MRETRAHSIYIGSNASSKSMVTIREIRNWIAEGEGPTVDFKNSGILSNPNDLAKLMVAFANTLGGHILIGINDDHSFEGLTTNSGHQSHIMNIARTNVDPPLTVSFENVIVDGNPVYVITVPKFTSYPHALRTSGGKVYYIRVGDTIREPAPQEMTLLFSGSPQNILTEIGHLRTEVQSLKEQIVGLMGVVNRLSQETPPSEPTSPTEEARGNLIGLIRSFLNRWTNFIASPPESQLGTNLDELQIFLRARGDDIMNTVAFAGESEATIVASEFGGRLRRLGEKRFFIDGGRSWREFLEEGNELNKEGGRLIEALSS